jgi:hypothetical protein
LSHLEKLDTTHLQVADVLFVDRKWVTVFKRESLTNNLYERAAHQHRKEYCSEVVLFGLEARLCDLAHNGRELSQSAGAVCRMQQEIPVPFQIHRPFDCRKDKGSCRFVLVFLVVPPDSGLEDKERDVVQTADVVDIERNMRTRYWAHE